MQDIIFVWIGFGLICFYFYSSLNYRLKHDKFIRKQIKKQTILLEDIIKFLYKNID